MRSARRVAGALVAAGMLALPAATSAGTYTDHLCRGPGGVPAPAAGFVGAASPAAEATSTCGTPGGSLRVALTGAGPWPGGAGANQRYTAPDGTTIAAFSLERSSAGLTSGALPGAGQAAVGFRVETDAAVVEACEPGGQTCVRDVAGPIARDGLSAGWLQFNAGCQGAFPKQCQAGGDGTGIALSVSAAKVVVRDERAPAVANVRGALLAPGAKRGQAIVQFDASDQGGGLYRLITVVDGKEAAISGLDQGSGTCGDANPADADPYEFLARIPCPLALANLSAAVDTTKIADGRHDVQILVEDAAGNRTPVFGPEAARIQVLNARANGSGADRRAKLRMWFATNRQARLVGRAGNRYVVRGRLVDRRGRGIRGARIDVYHVISGKPRLLKTGLKTRKAGRLTLILPINLYGDRNGWRRLLFSYTAFRPGPVTSRQTLRLQILDALGRPVRKG
jgi:hypothetical protein